MIMMRRARALAQAHAQAQLRKSSTHSHGSLPLNPRLISLPPSLSPKGRQARASFLLSFNISRSFSDDPASSSASASADDTNTNSLSESANNAQPPLFPDISNKELKRRLEKYYEGDEESELPSVAEAIFLRKLSRKHEETDDELLEELRNKPLPEVKDREFESDFEELYSTDEEIDNLYNARQYVEKKKLGVHDEFFNMDDKKWDELVRDGIEHGFLQDTKECEDLLEDMLSWDKLLPAEIKQKVEAKFNELEENCERGELEPEKAYEIFKEYEDKMVADCIKIMESEEKDKIADISEENQKEMKEGDVESDDPPGEGPILRWESRVVFAPGGDAWHPKNRKVKLSVTVKELGLSPHAFRRLREVVGKRYNSGKDELTITSERFEHREENRKDCLRTLYTLIADAMKAEKLVEEARNSFVKDKLKANPQFMERLKLKAAKMKESQS